MELVSQPVQWQCSLSHYTSFAIGGPAEAMVQVDQLRELQPLLAFFAEEDIPWRIIGKGTNLLVRDEGFPGVILRLGGELAAVAEEDGGGGSIIVRIGGGGSFARLSRRCSEGGLTGLEFGCGIPGTVGGAVIMNAGAWGRDIASVLRGVTPGDSRWGDHLSLRGISILPIVVGKVLQCIRVRAVVAGVELVLKQRRPVGNLGLLQIVARQKEGDPTK